MLYCRTTKGMLWLFFAAAIIAFLTLSTSVAAQDTLLINYQGRLTDNSGSPLTGNYDLIFGIYTMPVGPSQLWSETHSDVPVTDGLFTVILGSLNTLPDTVFGGTDRYLGITVGGDPEITPRSLMTSVPSAAYYNVDYTKLTPLLIEAIKELKAENEELRYRLDRLESR